MIQFFNVSKIYAGEVKVTALKDVTMNIDKGEFVFLVGPSGAGKSTLTKLIIREEVASSGQVMAEGKNLARMKQWEIPFYRRNIGFVFQDFRLLMTRTVYENVAFAAEAVELTRSQIRQRLPMILEMMGLETKKNAYPHQLSGGQQQRLGIARAMVNNPTMIIADEPTGNLDPETSAEIMQIFQAINRRGTTVLIATHDKAMVDKLRKRVVQLREGFVVRDEKNGGYSPVVWDDRDGSHAGASREPRIGGMQSES
ncbi:MAG: cell division ATP-binding protein FtsE [Clostridiales bacterium]|nr:cell division ATP-binding protein FtsE [Clostridiales bacterium]